MKTINLSNSKAIPILGFGTAGLTDKVCQRSVEAALEVGYRHIDTANYYQNQYEIAKVIKKSGVKRKDLFITSKVFYYDLEPEKVKEVCNKCLEELQTDYLDLFLIHWPNKNIPLRDTLQAFVELLEKGLIKSMGVSNFTMNHLVECLETGVPVVNNQLEFHPSLNQKELKNYCDEKGISVTAYAPLAQGQDLKLKVIKDTAKKHGKTPGQIIINWLVSKNIITIPRSSDPKRIKENWNSLNFSLTKRERFQMENLDKGNRIVNPKFAEFDY